MPARSCVSRPGRPPRPCEASGRSARASGYRRLSAGRDGNKIAWTIAMPPAALEVAPPVGRFLAAVCGRHPPAGIRPIVPSIQLPDCSGKARREISCRRGSCSAYLARLSARARPPWRRPISPHRVGKDRSAQLHYLRGGGRWCRLSHRREAFTDASCPAKLCARHDRL